MALTLITGRGTASFDTGDDVVVTLRVIDPPEVLLRKLRRVVALSESDPGGVDTVPPSVPVLAGEPQGDFSNGWAAMAAPKLPERLAGEVELIDPEVETDG
ncbi:hypothetical protein ACZ90_00255 [Streptomyces albus subsp. albus]|nr:hypothetical protein ACZ90_00255 [Streptomyces albus subsp. albus]